MEQRRPSNSPLWKDESSLLEAIDELLHPEEPEQFHLSHISDGKEDKSKGEHHYDEADYQMHRGAGFPHHHKPLKHHHRPYRRQTSLPHDSTQSASDLPSLEEEDDQESRLRALELPKQDRDDDKEEIPADSSTPLLGEHSKSFPTLSHSLAPVQSSPSSESGSASGLEKPLKSSLKKPSITLPTSPLVRGYSSSDDTPTADYRSSKNEDLLLSSTLRDKSSGASSQPESGSHKVAFILGNDAEESAEEKNEKSSSHRAKDRHHHHHHRHKHHKGHQLDQDGKFREVTEPEEAVTLQRSDLEEMASHRFEDPKGIRRHKIQAKSAVSSFIHLGKEDGQTSPSIDEKGKKIPFKKTFDRRPHEIFVELDELVQGSMKGDNLEWKETARWIKYEENLEEGGDRWGKPHLASLSFHSLLSLRKCLEQGTVLLDLEEKDLPGIANRVVDNMMNTDQIYPENHGAVLRALLLRHRHVSERGFSPFMRRNSSGTFTVLKSLRSASIAGITGLAGFTSRAGRSMRSASIAGGLTTHDHFKENQKRKRSLRSSSLTNSFASQDGVNGSAGNRSMPLFPSETRINLEKQPIDADAFSSSEDLRKQESSILRRIPENAEATTVLVGGLDFLDQPTIAFVRLAEGQIMPNFMEVPIPVRFLFILLGPADTDLDYHEIGRSISTLMSNRSFHEAAYRAEDRRDLLRAINEFMDDSIVLPPGDWEKKSLIPVDDIKKTYQQIRQRKLLKESELKPLIAPLEEKVPPPYDPLRRTRRFFGGLLKDVQNRYPWYISDFKDGLNAQCIASAIFIYFAALSGAITFGGLLGDKTDNLIGVSETLLTTCASGVLYALMSGQPLVIIGVTGPVLLFDELLFSFCKDNNIEFLSIRVWIGMWVAVLATLVVAFEGSAFVRFFTRFTQEIFAALISLLYIYEAFYKLYLIFVAHPLLSEYCPPEEYNISSFNETNDLLSNDTNTTFDVEEAIMPAMRSHPNTALLSSILMFSTFFIAQSLRQFRNSSFLGRSARRALGDFGIPITLVFIVTVDYFIPNTYTQKLKVPNGLTPSKPEVRGWIISPLGMDMPIVWWHIFVAAFAAVLVFILLFLEIQICELILSKKERKLQKGSGFHLDLLLIGFMELACALLGGPWMCAATVRSVSHVASLTIMSRTHAPGESPRILGVKEQRLSNLLVSLLIGLSVFMSPLLREVPVAVLFGVFLYMGVSSMSGIQLFERIVLFFKPAKHYPNLPYCRKVRYAKMHLYTLIQVFCLGVLWAVKSSALALAFPFVLLMMIPLRIQLKYAFTEKELQLLDGEQEEVTETDEDEPDFYQQIVP